MNITLLAKWWWKFKDPTCSSPRKTLIINTYEQGLTPPSAFWKAILAIKPIVQNSISYSPHSQNRVSFWKDIWYSNCAFSYPISTFRPEMYSARHNSLQEVLEDQGHSLRFNRHLQGIDLQDWQQLQDLLCTLLIDDANATMKWKWSSSGAFTVKSLYTFLNVKGVQVEKHMLWWKLKLPPKIKFSCG